jgi:DNA excision repair protein ERCC-3
LSSNEDQLDMLTRVLSAGEEDAAVEDDGMDDQIKKTAKAVAKRTTGSMGALTGGRGLSYMEFGTQRGSARPRLLDKSGNLRHKLFRDRAQGKV